MADAVEDATEGAARAAPPGQPRREALSVASPGEAQGRIDELTAQLAARDSFLGLVGHELRNAVAPMLLLAEQFAMLADDPKAPPMIASRVAMLIRNLNKFVATVDRVAEVSDLRRGRLLLDLTTVDLVEVAAEVCRDAGREAAAGSAELVIDASGPLTGRWDRARLRQIIANLVSNAIRYGGGGRIELAITERGPDAELVIRDHGPGLEPSALPHLFERFDHDRNRRGGGFGIGLWLVKTLCTAMRGSVTAHNDTSGGAFFCVVLPRG
jgi:signal transduction histidine kinase